MKKIILYLLVSTSLCFSQDNFWEQTNGPYGGWGSPIAIDSSGNIFIGSTGEGIFKSTDNGYSWVKINNGLNINMLYFSSIIFNTKGYVFICASDGIYRSSNKGDEWIRANNGITYYWDLYTLSTNSKGDIFAGTGNGIYRSVDNGDNWIFVNNGINITAPATPVLSLLVNSSDNIFAGTTKGAYRSTNNGDSWTEINNGFNYSENSEIYVQSLGIGPSGDLFAATSQGLYRTSDNGDNWVSIDGDLPTDPPYGYWCLAINSVGHIFVGELGNGIIRSTDNGEHWSNISVVKTNDPVQIPIIIEGIAINSEDQIFAGANGNGQGEGVYRSTDNGETWTKIGAVMVSVNSLASNLNNYIFAGSLYNGVFRSIDYGSSWKQIINHSHITSLVINTLGNIFVGSIDNKIYLSSDNGDNWAKLVKSTSSNVLAINSNNNIFVGVWASIGESIERSTDNGDSWVEINDGIIGAYIDENSPLYYSKVKSIVFDSNNNVFVGTLGDSGIYKSTDNGDHWVLFSNGFTGDSTYALVIAKNGYIYASTNAGIFQSVDDGENWININNEFPDDRIFTFVLDKSGYIYAGTDSNGVLVSTDNGESWTQIISGLNEKSVYSLTIDQQDHIYAGTQSGVYKGTISSIIPVELISFNGSFIDNAIRLRWSTATETNNKGFEIERSPDGKGNWQRIEFIEGNGTTTNKNSYSFIDKNVSTGTYSYRLKQIDFDGSFKYSNIVEINI